MSKQESDLVQSVQSAGRHPNIVRCHGVLVQNEGTALSTSCVTTREMGFVQPLAELAFQLPS